jgi:hypothetical protein
VSAGREEFLFLPSEYSTKILCDATNIDCKTFLGYYIIQRATGRKERKMRSKREKDPFRVQSKIVGLEKNRRQVLGELREAIGPMISPAGFETFLFGRQQGLGMMRPVDLLGTPEGVQILFRFVENSLEL